MATKRQTTMAKIQREQALRERRELKQQKKRAAAEARSARTAGSSLEADGVDALREDSAQATPPPH
jgi:hypothetical protein